MSDETQANEPELLRHDSKGVATLTLNRPRARNALSSTLMATLQGELDSINTDESIRAVVLAANGPVFCAGHDMRELMANRDVEYYKATFARSSQLMLTLTRLRQPVIARVQATATAAGTQLVASCDLAVAAREARFCTPGVNIGLFCSTPMVALSRAVGRKQAMEMLVTGDMIDAETARRFGLINRVVDGDRLIAETAALAAQIADKSPYVLALGKEAFYRQAEMGLEEAYAYAGGVMARNMMANDACEGINAFLEKRAPVWEGR